jgi:UDP-GlcNAc:undecaprenyl-phosphate GlcNAc-1-phosphate transferase
MWMWAALVAFGTVLASLYSGWWVVAALAAMTLTTVGLTFLLPRLHRPRLPVTEVG